MALTLRYVWAAVSFAGIVALAGCGRGRAGHANAPAVLSSAIASGRGLNAGGEQPLWALQIRGREVTFSSEKVASITLANTGPVAFPNGAAWTGEAGGQTFRAAITAVDCRDGATGLAYPLSASVTALGGVYRGCAAKAGQGLGPRG